MVIITQSKLAKFSFTPEAIKLRGYKCFVVDDIEEAGADCGSTAVDIGAAVGRRDPSRLCEVLRQAKALPDSRRQTRPPERR